MPLQFNVQIGTNPQPANENIAAKDTSLQYLLGKEWRNIRWNLGGAFLYDKCNQLHLSTYSELFQLNVPPVTISGVVPCLWSLDWFEFSKIMPPALIRQCIKQYEDRKAPLFLNFDNPGIRQEDLNDSLGNALMSFITEGNSAKSNGVYVASDLLARHIRQNFKGLPVRAGVNRSVMENKRDADFYNKLAGMYDLVAIHPADFFNEEIISGLKDKNKFEITVNDTCLDTCPCRKEHMEVLGKIRREPWNVLLLRERHACLDKAKCELIKRPAGSRPLSLTYQEFDRLYTDGFRYFRLQAESLRNELTYTHYLIRWLYNNDESAANKLAMLYSTLLISRQPEQASYPNGMSDYITRKYD